LSSRVADFGWSGLTSDESPMILRDLIAREVYALRSEIR
jgi:hypothetical protein